MQMSPEEQTPQGLVVVPVVPPKFAVPPIPGEPPAFLPPVDDRPPDAFEPPTDASPVLEGACPLQDAHMATVKTPKNNKFDGFERDMEAPD